MTPSVDIDNDDPDAPPAGLRGQLLARARGRCARTTSAGVRNAPFCSTSCTRSTICWLIGAGDPAVLRGRDDRAVEEVDLGQLTAPDALQRRSRDSAPSPCARRASSGTTPRTRAEPSRSRRAPARSRPEPARTGCRAAARRGPSRACSPSSPCAAPGSAIDLLHAEPGDRGQRVDVVDEQLRPLGADDVVGHLDRDGASRSTPATWSSTSSAVPVRGPDDQRERRGDRDPSRLEIRGGEEREPAEQRGLRQHRARDLEAAETVLRDEQRRRCRAPRGSRGGRPRHPEPWWPGWRSRAPGAPIQARVSCASTRATCSPHPPSRRSPCCLDRREVLAASRDLDVVSRTIEKGGQGSPDRPGSDDRDAHASSLGRRGR